PRQRQGLIKSRRELLAVPDRLLEGTAGGHDGNLRRIDNRREISSADTAEAGDRETAALHLVGLELAVARKLGEIDHLLGDVDNALLVGVADDWHDQPLRRVSRKADVVIFLENEIVALKR